MRTSRKKEKKIMQEEKHQLFALLLQRDQFPIKERRERGGPRIEAASVMGKEKRRVMSSSVSLGFGGEEVEAAPVAPVAEVAGEEEGCKKNESGSGDVIRFDNYNCRIEKKRPAPDQIGGQRASDRLDWIGLDWIGFGLDFDWNLI
jgi:hypothetical protein